MTVTEIETETDTDTDIYTDIETETETDRQTDRQRDRVRENSNSFIVSNTWGVCTREGGGGSNKQFQQ